MTLFLDAGAEFNWHGHILIVKRILDDGRVWAVRKDKPDNLIWLLNPSTILNEDQEKYFGGDYSE